MDYKGLALAQLFSNAALGYFRGRAQRQLQESTTANKYADSAYKFMEKQVNDKNTSAEQRNAIYQQMRAINPNLPEMSFSDVPDDKEALGNKVSGILSEKQKLNYTPTALPEEPQGQITLGQFGGYEQPLAPIQQQIPEIVGKTPAEIKQALNVVGAAYNIPQNQIEAIQRQAGLISAEDDKRAQQRKSGKKQPSAAMIKLYRELKPAQKKQADEIQGWLKYYYDLTKRGEVLSEDEKEFANEASSMLEKLYDKKPLNRKDFMRLRKFFGNRRAFPKSESLQEIFRKAGLLPGGNEQNTAQPEAQPTGKWGAFERKQ